MKNKTFCLILTVSFIIFSCETLGLNLTGILSPPTSNSSNTTQRNTETHIDFGQAAGNTDRNAAQDTKNWDIAKLDTAANVDYLTDIEKDVILEMNKVRTNPGLYAELYIQPLIRFYSGRNFSVPGQITIVTQEGVAAVNECIAALNRASSAGLLYPERGLSLASRDHVADQSRTGQLGHTGSDGSTPQTRARRYGTFGGSWTIGENITYGSRTGREIVVDLLIDDGVPDRGHRINIMNRAFTQTGAAFGTHPQYRTSSTIKYADGYISN